MSRYYGDEEEHSWGYGQDFLSPEPPSRPLNHRRRYSKEERAEERPRLQRNYYSDNEAYGHQKTEEWGEDDSGQHSGKQMPSPPLPPPPPPSLGSRRNDKNSTFKRTLSPPRFHFKRDLARSNSGIEGWEIQPRNSDGTDRQRRAPAGTGDTRLFAPYGKRVPSPPGVRREETRHYSYPTNSDNIRDIPSLPVRLSPTLSHPATPESSRQRKKSVSKSYTSKHVSPAESVWKERKASPPIDPRCVRYRVPSPPAVNRRRHSNLDVPSTRLKHTQNYPELSSRHAPQSGTSVRLNGKPVPYIDRLPDLQVPLPVPGSFPSPPDTIQPEDSRSETSRSTKKNSSGDAFSQASDSRLQQSISRSVSGVLGENVYRYKQLDAVQFRLVRILPKTMSQIKCELAHYSLEDPPGYVAISYAWGDADEKKRIQLEGTDIPVSASLHGALFALRAKKESVLVWADALSIDQQNVAERTQQVQLMTEIYSRAVSVAIWLGPEASDSNLAMETLTRLTAQSTDDEHIESLMSTELGNARFASVVALFERDYWSRLWVVQEVFNAREITVYCGATSLPWSVYRLASDVFWSHKGLIEFYFPGSLSHGGRGASSTQFTYSQVLVYHGPSSIPDVSSFHGLEEDSLLEVMRICRRKLSADPRDKLYGMLGLLPEDIRNEFPVDYSLSVKEVYLRVFDYLICTTERLDVLCEAVHFPLHTNINLPTWVPDWSHNPETTALGRSCGFSATGSLKAVARILEDRKKLEFSAIHLDTIRGHGIAVGTLCTLADYVMAFIHWRAQLLSNTEDGESEERQEEFCRTLSLNQLPPGWKDGSWRAACYHVFASLAHERIPRLPLDEELWRYVDANVGVKTKDRRRFLQEHFGSRMMGRCFCITELGSMGMGSGFMAAGDTVVVPLGCPTPVLLRPEGPRGEYRYVGDVYIHGYMEGKAVQQWQNGERELRKFVLH